MPDRIEHLERLLRERIVIIDGAMGTMIQQRKLDEAAFRGERFADWRGKDLKGLQRPAESSRSRRSSRTSIASISKPARTSSRRTRSTRSPSRWRITGWNRWPMNCPRPARNARGARRTRLRKRSPAGFALSPGAIGPTTKTSSISTDVNNPGARGTNYDELVTAYGEQINGLLDGGADVLLVETIFDTLNARAAFFAIQKIFDERGIEPLSRRTGVSPVSDLKTAKAENDNGDRRMPVLQKSFPSSPRSPSSRRAAIAA